ncbi:MAG: cupredoxin domain-containing protein [Chloroflexota bacterium]
MKPLIVLIGIALVVVVLIAIGVGGTVGGRSGAAEISMYEMRFAPSQIYAKVGVPITVRLSNVGNVRHDLAFPSVSMPNLQGIETNLGPGESGTITLRFDEAGTYTFICTLPGHAASGMTGAVFVRP